MTKFELPKLDSYDDHFFVILHFPPLSQKVGISPSYVGLNQIWKLGLNSSDIQEHTSTQEI